MPKMYSLYSEASMFPRRSSHARNRRLESWLRVSFVMSKSNQQAQLAPKNTLFPLGKHPNSGGRLL